jgi:Cu/Ag efflux protein CusF
MNPLITAAAMAFLTVVTVSAMADSGHINMKHGTGMMHNSGMAMAMAKMSEGTVKNVDRLASKITIAHGPLENLGMPGMTMAFAVKDKARLDQLKAGDKVRFVAADMGGTLTVTDLEAAN